MHANGNITIIGAGLMGTAIATLCAAHGHQVVLCDQSVSMLDSFAERAAPIASSLAGAAASAERIMDRIVRTASVEEAVRGAVFVHEVIHEDIEAKRELFEQLDALCPADVMLATNTSSYMLTEICERVAGRHRVIGIHYVSPPHLIRAVEIITASFTDPALIGRAQAFLASIDHVGIVCRERPGFLINRIQYALKAELAKIVEEGVASVENIDAAVRLSIGPRLALWGPMMQEDLSTSKRTVLAVSEYLHEATGDAHFATTGVLRALAERGQLGASSGAGWYRWDGHHADRVKERDRQLGDLLTWLRANERLEALGARGENEDLQRGNPVPDSQASDDRRSADGHGS